MGESQEARCKKRYSVIVMEVAYMKQRTIHFKLLGGFSFCSDMTEEWTRLDRYTSGSMGRKLRSFLEYLIINHNREISSAELIGQFWPESSSSSPENSLKYAMHKSRLLLQAMFPAYENLITTQRGGYAWADNVRLELDTEKFEQLSLSKETGLTSQSLTQMLEAINLYEGDLLPGNNDDWLQPLRTYYNSLCINTCKNALELLREENRWVEIANICEHAYTLEPGIEEFTTYYMHALVALGQPDKALRHYETFRIMLWQKFSLVPTELVEQARTLAIEVRSNSSLSKNEILRLVTDEADDLSAFSCSFSVFRSIVHLEKRLCKREKRQSTIVMVSLPSTKGEDGVSTQPSATDILRIERILLNKLRKGDPVTRLNMGSFLVLLSGASVEDAHEIMERIRTQFRKTYPRSKARANYYVYPIG